jgi:hypothetical protein
MFSTVGFILRNSARAAHVARTAYTSNAVAPSILSRGISNNAFIFIGNDGPAIPISKINVMHATTYSPKTANKYCEMEGIEDGEKIIVVAFNDFTGWVSKLGEPQTYESLHNMMKVGHSAQLAKYCDSINVPIEDAETKGARNDYPKKESKKKSKGLPKFNA